MSSREKDTNWALSPTSSGKFSFDSAHLAVLMDLRDELKQLNRVFACYNFTQIPAVLRAIKRNTAPRVRYKKAKR